MEYTGFMCLVEIPLVEYRTGSQAVDILKAQEAGS